jgi:hypothetical protein
LGPSQKQILLSEVAYEAWAFPHRIFCTTVHSFAAFAATATVKSENPVVYSAGSSGTNFVVSANLNGDGFPDMIVANTDGVSVLNHAYGTFGPPLILL